MMRILTLAFVSLLILAPGSAQAQSPGELRVAIPWTPENLDPTMNLSSFRAMVGVSLFDSLVGRDAENRIVPQLAESWRLVDEVTWQLKLRRGVVFHDGEPFNAEAVRFTFQRVLDPEQKSPNRANVAEIVRVEVVDDYTVNLVTRQPYAPLDQPAPGLRHRSAQVRRRERQPGHGPAPGGHGSLPLRRADQGRPDGRRGL